MCTIPWLLLLVGLPLAFWLGCHCGAETQVWYTVRKYVDSAFPGDKSPARTTLEYRPSSEESMASRRPDFQPFTEMYDSPRGAQLFQRRLAQALGESRDGREEASLVSAESARCTEEAAVGQAESLDTRGEARTTQSQPFCQPERFIAPAPPSPVREPMREATPPLTYSSMAASSSGKPERFDLTKVLSLSDFPATPPGTKPDDSVPAHIRRELDAAAAQKLAAQETEESRKSRRDQMFTDKDGKPYTWDYLKTHGATCTKCEKTGHTAEQCGVREKVFLRPLPKPAAGPFTRSQSVASASIQASKAVNTATSVNKAAIKRTPPAPLSQSTPSKGGADMECAELVAHIIAFHQDKIAPMQAAHRIQMEAKEVLATKSGPEGTTLYKLQQSVVDRATAEVASFYKAHGFNCDWKVPIDKGVTDVQKPIVIIPPVEQTPVEQPIVAQPTVNLASKNSFSALQGLQEEEEKTSDKSRASVLLKAPKKEVEKILWSDEVNAVSKEAEPHDVESALNLTKSWIRDSPCHGMRYERRSWLNSLETLLDEIQAILKANVEALPSTADNQVDLSLVAFQAWRNRVDYRIGSFLNNCFLAVRQTEESIKVLEAPTSVVRDGTTVPATPAASKPAVELLQALRDKLFESCSKQWSGYLSSIDSLDSKLQGINGAPFVKDAAAIKGWLTLAHPKMPTRARAAQEDGWLPRVSLKTLPSLRPTANLTHSYAKT